MTHTQGPWHLDSMKVRSNGNLRIMAEQCTPVAIVPEHMISNAQLIAAAPAMLEALKSCLANARMRRESGFECGPTLDREIERTEQAIRLAEGRS